MTESRPDRITEGLDASDWVVREVRDDGDRVTGYQVIATTAGAERIVADVPYRGYADWLVTRLSLLGHDVSAEQPSPEMRADLRETIAPYVGPGYGPIDGLLSALDPFLLSVYAAGVAAGRAGDGPPSSPRLGHVPGRSW